MKTKGSHCRGRPILPQNQSNLSPTSVFVVVGYLFLDSHIFIDTFWTAQETAVAAAAKAKRDRMTKVVVNEDQEAIGLKYARNQYELTAACKQTEETDKQANEQAIKQANKYSKQTRTVWLKHKGERTVWIFRPIHGEMVRYVFL